MTATDVRSSIGANVFADFVKEAMTLEDERRESIERRSRAAITLSGTMVTLLLALSSVAANTVRHQLPVPARWLLLAAVIMFTVSAIAAVATILPQIERAVDPRALLASLPSRWQWTEDSALKKVTATRLAKMITVQRANAIKAVLLLGSVVFQVIAIGLLACAASVVLTSAP